MIEHAPHIFEPETRGEFEDWIEDFPRGYVINRKSSGDVRIHLGKCGHFKGMPSSMDLLKSRKVLSRDGAALRGWWAEQGEAKPVDCHCLEKA